MTNLLAPLAPADDLATEIDLPTFDMPVSGDSLVKLGLRDRAQPRVWDRVAAVPGVRRLPRVKTAPVPARSSYAARMPLAV